MELKFSKDNCAWKLVADSAEEPTLLLPKEMVSFLDFIRETVSFSGTNGELADAFNAHSGAAISPKGLKQMMNKWRYPLEEQGVSFRSYRSNGQRLVEVSFSALESVESDPSAASDSNDGNIGSAKICVTCDPCVPETAHGPP